MLPEILVVTGRDVSDSAHVLTATGEIDHDSREVLRKAVDDAFARGRVHLALDLTAVTFCDSGGLSLFVDVHRESTGRDGWLRLAGAGAPVLSVLQATNLDLYLDIYPTIDDAIGGGR
jgi:anti-anti-sigma factor